MHATEVGTTAKSVNLDPGKEFTDTVHSTNYTTSAPPPLQAQGLSLDQNYAPMGIMSLVNASVSFAQCPGALSLEAAALETYFGGLHAADQRNSGFWGALAPAVAMPPQLSGTSITDQLSPLDVEIDSANGPQIRWCCARRWLSRAARIPASTRRRSFSLFTRCGDDRQLGAAVSEGPPASRVGDRKSPWSSPFPRRRTRERDLEEERLP